MVRISAVRRIDINDIGLASICLLGDCVEIVPTAQALAVQRQYSIYNGNEGALSAFPIFRRPIPVPSCTNEVHMQVMNRNPYIAVDEVDILAFSSSAIMQVGSNERIRCVNRLKHIRQLVHRPGEARLT
ncbi:spore germination protein GerPE [Paenibacillus ginsengarvi]|uniref:spore germination protein GerPE n=1 Tax=Paenibacillus ginsengarvi TaxID=400777 RepID=UPI00131510A2|nr:spore germination protein GerPE [Paenibacillus ginsengarvi]